MQLRKVTFTIVLTAVCLVIVSAKSRKEIIKEINRINSVQKLWKAGINDLNNRSLKQLVGTLRPSNEHQIKRKRVPVANSIPYSFDSRSQWSGCPSISSIKDQGSCGSCWAVAAASCASDRLCIKTGYQVQLNLSAENLLACCYNCASNGGCNGGWPIKAWQYLEQTGIVTGGDYGSYEGCQPYEIRPTGDANSYYTPPCYNTQCTNNYYNTPYAYDLHYANSAYYIENDVSQIQSDLMTYGPVEATMDVYEDFDYYTGGVYVRTSNQYVGGHAIRVLGWGTDSYSGVDYWLAANSWNRNWGEDGTFRIRRGTNECGFESSMTAGTMYS